MTTKLLIANRGEIAARVMRTAHGMGIGTVAVFSDADADMPYAALADEAVRLPGVTPSDTYLRIDLVVAAALRTGSDAVHPGYGFLSENAAFARAVTEAGLTFVGPSPDAIAAMGDKVAAKALMESAGVPVLPGAVFAAEHEPSDAELVAAGERVGYPLLVKAAFGGGGRGMRVVEHEGDLVEAVHGARREAASAFGDGTVFLERYLSDPRHIEVQILGDRRGGVVHLFERECSIQRRYQKIVEESPSTAVSSELRAELGAAAVSAGKAIGYTGAGTVEFVLAGTGEFYFLEVNTRLQVEHPVTELVTGLDLVELQLRIADGEPLPTEVLEAQIDGHAIEVRLYAEDVPAGYLPTTGTLHDWHIPDVPGVRVDSGVEPGSVVGPHYDPMLAKVIAYGRTRTEAARRLARALTGARIHGVTTNRDLLAAILRDHEFMAGNTTTSYLTRSEAVSGVGCQSSRHHSRVVVVAALARQAGNRAAAGPLRTLPSGWRNAAGAAQRVGYVVGEETFEVAYRLGRDGLDVRVNGQPLGKSVRLVHATEHAVVLEIEGVRREHAVHRVGDQTYVDGPDGSATLTELPRFPDPVDAVHAGSLLAPMPGTVVRRHAEVGDEVAAGQLLIVLEAMKMEHSVAAPMAGTVSELPVRQGDQVDTGQVLAVVTPTESRQTV